MKKAIIPTLFAMLFIGIFAAGAGNDRMIRPDQLPTQSRRFIARHFPGETIVTAELERDDMQITYEATLSDGTQVEFLRTGAWKEVDCRYASVPAAIVPQKIASYVARQYPGASIVRIERGRHDYEIELADGRELTFDARYRLVEIDD